MPSGFRIRTVVESRSRVALLALGLACAVIGLGAAQTPSDSKAASSGGTQLEGVLAGMDRAAARFSSVSADLEYTKVTVIVDDHSTEHGKIYFEKSKGKLRVMLAFQQPAEKYVLFADGKVAIYRPKIAVIEEYSLANNQGLLEQFLLLGFGTAGSDLQKNYRLTLKGEETLDGETAVLLELVPKNPEVSTRLQRIELWLSPETWQPRQQIFYEPSKDYLIARYRNSRQNTKIPGKNFEFPVRGKVRTVRPQDGN